MKVRSRATGDAAPIGSVSCRGKIGKAAAPLARKRTVRGSATCTWRLPRSARGKRFTGTIPPAGGAATRSFAVPIR
ncbi:MAG: hypothetical protein M3540_12895 [Actinomycetota bacterium]|nr:hypothetical protein [Actinomycetota bacterium]